MTELPLTRTFTDAKGIVLYDSLGRYFFFGVTANF